MDERSLGLWRLATNLTLENAAILLAGGDPGEMEFPHDVMPWSKGAAKVKVTSGHIGFDAAYSAIKGAVIVGELPARLIYYTAEVSLGGEPIKAPMIVLAGHQLQAHLPSATVVFEGGGRSIVIASEPAWPEAIVNVDDLKGWLRRNGHTYGFFFPDVEPKAGDILGGNPDRLSDELSLALCIWRNLSEREKFPRGAKKAIEAWIEDHPEAWLGKRPPTKDAKARVATLTNWNKKGGAPKTGS